MNLYALRNELVFVIVQQEASKVQRHSNFTGMLLRIMCLTQRQLVGTSHLQICKNNNNQFFFFKSLINNQVAPLTYTVCR